MAYLAAMDVIPRFWFSSAVAGGFAIIVVLDGVLQTLERTRYS